MNSTSKPVLKIDWATHDAVKFAVENWHYSHAMPAGKLVKVGAWEDGKFIGCVLFGRGSTGNIGKPYNLEQTEICELVRIALTTHKVPVSKIMALALKMLRQQSSGVRLVVSYADKKQGHHGGIYQATNWVYVGDTLVDCSIRIHGSVIHRRSVYAKYGNQRLEWIRKNVDPLADRVFDEAKHKYLMPLDDEMREQIAPLTKPYPKRSPRAKEQDAGHHPALGGVTPTRTLQILEAA